MPTIQIELPVLHRTQRAIAEHPARFKVLSCGRRYGKTELAVDEITNSGIDGLRVAYVCPTYKMLSEVWRKVKQVMMPVITSKNETEKRLEFVTGGSVDFWSGENADALRGRAYHKVIIDEAALIPNLLDIWNNVIRPLLTDYQGSALFLSTPRGLNGFFELYSRGVSDGVTWQSWQYPTSANPHILISEIEDARLSLPENSFRQEYLAEFIEDGSLFRGVSDVSVLTQRTPYEGRFAFGIDFAQTEDYTVVSVLDTQTKQQVYVDRYNRASWQLQRNRIKSLYEQWKPRFVLAETNSIGSVNIEALQADGVRVTPFTTTAQSKREIIDALALAIEQKTIVLLNHPVQIAELTAFQMERTAAGNFKYSAPAGMHDDTVMALALAWHAANVSRLSKPIFMS